MMLLSAESNMYDFGLSEVLVIFIVALFFGLGIFTLLKFRKNKNF